MIEPRGLSAVLDVGRERRVIHLFFFFSFTS
jgi:hypothetical protein